LGKPFKVVANSDAGDADHYGGNDIDNMAGWLNAQSDYHTYTYFVYKESTTYKAKKGTDGTVSYSDTDFKTVIQSIVDDISPAGTPTLIKLAAGDFLLQAEFTIPASRIGNITIEGMGPGLTNILIGSGFNSLHSVSAITVGTSPTINAGNTGTLTANKLVNSIATTMSSGDVAKFAVGDYVLLRTGRAWCSPATSSSVCKQGEIHKVSVTSGTNVTIDSPAFDTYNTADTAELINITSYIIKNITLRGFTIKKDSGYTGNDDSYFLARLCDNLFLDNIHTIDDVKQFDSAISLYSCINSSIVNCKLIQNPTNTYNSQYGITIRGACQNVIIDHCQSVGKYRHPFELASGSTTAGFEGPSRHITAANCHVWNSAVGSFDSHADGEFITISNCQVGGAEGGYGFYSRCKSMKIVNCTVNSTRDNGMEFEENAHGCEVINCTIANVANTSKYGIWIDTSVTNIKINGTKFVSCKNQCVGIGDQVSDVLIDGCMFDSCAADNTSSEGIIHATGYCSDLTVTNNDFSAGTAPANSTPVYIVTGVDRFIFTGNNVDALTNKKPVVPAASGFIRVRDNIGLNLGKTTNFVDSTNHVIAFFGGNASAVIASTDYLIEGSDVILTSTGGTGVSITIKDDAGNTVAGSLTTLTAQHIPNGFQVNWGGFSVAPTVTMFAE